MSTPTPDAAPIEQVYTWRRPASPDEDALALTFHENTKWFSRDVDALQGRQPIRPPPQGAEIVRSHHFTPPDSPRLVRLPDRTTAPAASFETVLRGRRSWRAFRPAPLPLDQASFLLACTYGVTGRESTRWGDLLLRSAASAGSRYPLEVYALVLQGGELPRGAYHYRPEAHALEPLRVPLDDAQVERALLFSPAVRGASIVLLVTAVWARTLDKYGDRGYRAVLMEAGAVAHNACLAATALGLGAVTLEGADAVQNQLVGADSFDETTLTAVAIGHKADATGPTSYDPIQGG